MPTTEVVRAKRAMVIEQIAEARFPYPSAEEPNWETAVNFPDRTIGVQVRGGGWVYPDIMATEEPGHFIRVMGEVALAHEITEGAALQRWAPLAKAGPLYLYVPSGNGGRAARLCRKHKISLAGLRTYRQRPSNFGIDIEEAYAGPDFFAPVAAILPPILRPRAYQEPRQRVVEAYLSPPPAGRVGALPEPGETLALPAPAAEEAHAEGAAHLPPPSWAPLMVAAGLILTGFGAVFPAELLGPGITVLVIGILRWWLEDIGYFEAGGPAEARHHKVSMMPGAPEAPEGVHMPPPSLSPLMFAGGLILTGLGAVYPAQFLGAGITLLTFGIFSWWWEDVVAFITGGHDESGDSHHAGHTAGHAG